MSAPRRNRFGESRRDVWAMAIIRKENSMGQTVCMACMDKNTAKMNDALVAEQRRHDCMR